MDTRQLPSGLIVPSSACGMVYRCAVCGTEFREHAPALERDEYADTGSRGEVKKMYERHVAECVKKHEEAIQAFLPSTRAPGLFGPEAGDPEYEYWVEKHGRVK